MKKINTQGINFKNAQQLTEEQMKKVMGGVVRSTSKMCTATAYCGANGEVSCTGYSGGSSSGCSAQDDIGAFCPDQNGTMQGYYCYPQ